MENAAERLKRGPFFFIIGGVLFALAFSLVGLIASDRRLGDVDSKSQVDELWEETSIANGDSEVGSLFLQVADFDAELQKAKIIAFLVPPTEYADSFSSSFVTRKPFQFFIDNADKKTVYRLYEGETLGGVEALVDVNNPLDLHRAGDVWYPFDQYSFEVVANLGAINTENGIDQITPIPLNEYEYSNGEQDFDLTYSRCSSDPESPCGNFETIENDRNNGQTTTIITISRNISSQLFAILVAVFFFVTSFSLAAMALLVSMRKRPPSVSALTWSAASLLGLMELRTLFPGKPRIGIAIDLLSFFPSLIVTAVSTLALVYMWSTREDYVMD
jgi:hypothetical protein